MDTRLNWIFPILLIGVTMVAMVDVTFDFKLGMHDFSQAIAGKSVFKKFWYHFSLMLQPTIILLAIVMNSKGLWKRIALYGLLWSAKDCVDVILNNNMANTFWIDLIYLTLIILIYELWIRNSKKGLLSLKRK